MDKGDSRSELDVAEIIRKVKGTDEYSPEARAACVYEYLKKNSEFTNWDALCFAAEYTGSMVGACPWLLTPARDLIRAVYTAHYIRFEDIAWLDKQISEQGKQPSKEKK